MTEITIEKYAGKMNRAGYDAFLQAMRHARSERNRSVELCHWLFYSLSNKDADLSVTLAELNLDRGRVLKDLDKAMNKYGVPTFEAVANTGEGVFPTLKTLAGMVLESIDRMDHRRNL